MPMMFGKKGGVVLESVFYTFEFFTVDVVKMFFANCID